jgi:hypothetical protein
MQVHGTFNPASLVGPALVLLVWVGLSIYCINDLYQPSRHVLGFTKDVWALIILFIGIIGAVCYLLYGRDTSSR